IRVEPAPMRRGAILRIARADAHPTIMPNPITTPNQSGTRTKRLARRASRFVASRRGNVAVTVAVAALPMLSAVGCGIDFALASMVKTKLTAAADAATLATVSNNSPIVASAKSSGSVTGGNTYATNFFSAGANTTISNFNLSVTPTASVTMSGTTVTAKVSFTGTVPTYFLGLIGYKKIPISGSST